MNLTLNTGVEMPALGFGVFQTPPAETVDGLDTGVRGGPEPAAITLESFGREIPEA
jgi:diketogulonate reductase-like aldo/keto reductase